MLTNKDIQRIYGWSHQTVKNYSKRFAPWLSATAQPEQKRTRAYVEDDLLVFSLILEMKTTHKTYEEIEASLAAGQRGDMPAMPNELAILQSNSELAKAIRRVTELESELSEVGKRLDRAEGKVELLEKQLKETQRELKVAEKRVTQLELGLKFGGEG